MSIISCSKESLNNIPSMTGIYIFYNQKEIIYIGKSVNLKARIKSHFENAKIDAKEAAIVQESDKIRLIIVESEFKALLLESLYIQRNEPKYNIIWKDDRSYLYIKINIKDKYPKVLAVRRENDEVSKYFGPFHSNRIVEKLLHEIRRSFPFCTQTKISKRSCFYSKLGFCNPCPSYVESIEDIKEKSRLQKIYKSNTRQIVKIFEGKTDLLLKNYYQKLNELSKDEKYEEALIIRNRIFALQKLITERLFLNDDMLTPLNLNRIQEELLKILGNSFSNLKKINRIECYDISNLRGKLATGSMVVAEGGLLNKKEYRKFKIKKINGQKLSSDFEMLQDVVGRRFKNNWTKPDLIVIDGGKPQVRTIFDLLISLKINIPLIGIAKNPDRIVVGNNNFETIKINQTNIGFNLIRLIRDESHRFARKYHLLLREGKLV